MNVLQTIAIVIHEAAGAFFVSFFCFTMLMCIWVMS
jgi:hypothetical protein